MAITLYLAIIYYYLEADCHKNHFVVAFDCSLKTDDLSMAELKVHLEGAIPQLMTIWWGGERAINTNKLKCGSSNYIEIQTTLI